jgi:hypothetical protein
MLIFLEILVDLEILEFSTLVSDVHTPFTLTLKKEQSHCEDADAGVIPKFLQKTLKNGNKKNLVFFKIILILIN